MPKRSPRPTWPRLLSLPLLAALLAAPAQGSAPHPPASASAAVTDLLLAAVGDLSRLAELAASDDPVLAAAATRRLRAAGPAGLAAFIARHRAAIDLAPGADLSPQTAALDHICGQRDCAPARLYWYTDLEQAKAAARASGRPIVSLRLLGDLRDELSCANSRFFRALLYPDPAVSAALRERFVLHWHSERPAPRLTIDLGDGRSVTTTITGNSAHLILDSAGRPVDVLPGLLEPQQFLAALLQVEPLARALADQDAAARAATLARHHRERRDALARQWQDTLAAVGQPPRPLPQQAPDRPEVLAPPRAGQAAMLALSKSSAEVPLLRLIGEPVTPLSDADLWQRLVDRQAPRVQLSAASLALIARQQWRSGDPQRDAAELELSLVELRRSVALDGLYNEFALHHRVHTWFATQGAAELDLQALSDRVYRELFLTPRGDPWLGLAAPSVYSGLVGGGRRQDAQI